MVVELLLTVGHIILDVCLPIILVIGVGWLFDRRFNLDLESLVKLNIYLFVPTFIFVRVTESEIASALGLRIVAFTACMIACMAVTSLVIARLKGYAPNHQKTLLLTSMFYNCGNFGIPLTSLAFPETGPAVQVFVVMTMNLATFTLGLSLASSCAQPEQRMIRLNLGPVLKQPSVYAILMALLLKSGNVPVKEVVFLWKPATLIADALLGVALITLGVQLAKTKQTSFRGPLTWALGIRLIGGPVCALLLIMLFRFETEIAAVLLIGTAAPTAVNTALLAHEFKADSHTAAAAVLWSTLLSFLPVAALLLWIRLAWPL